MVRRGQSLSEAHARWGQITGAAIVAIGLIMPFEGRNHEVYYDPLHIATYCDGQTYHPLFGHRYTDTECDALIKVQVTQIETEFDRAVKTPISSDTKAAFISFVYNVGNGQAGKKDGFYVLKNGHPSTMLRKLIAGDVRGACNELPKWANPPLPGLVRRRKAEQDLCLKGLQE